MYGLLYIFLLVPLAPFAVGALQYTLLSPTPIRYYQRSIYPYCDSRPHATIQKVRINMGATTRSSVIPQASAVVSGSFLAGMTFAARLHGKISADLTNG